LTSEIERIKILEGKITRIVDYINTLTDENGKLKQQIKTLKQEHKTLTEQTKKVGQLDENLKKYEKEREVIRGKIDTIINQIDKLEI